MYRFHPLIRSVSHVIFLTFNFSFVSLLRVLPYLTGKKQRKRWTILWQFLLPWSFWIGLGFVIGWNDWLFVFVIPLLIANVIVSSYIATNHNLNPMVPVNDPLANSLSVTVPKWIDVLHFQFSYHVEHHIFPGMNPKYYPLVKKQILRLWPERYHCMPFVKALVLLWKTPRVYYRRKSFIDPATKHLYPTLGHGLEQDV